jgi:DNA-binding CsgD family transcriptional regulator
LLPGREREGVFLNELLSRVRAGHSAAIVVHGEAGVGKTALLNEAFGAVPDLRVVRAAGVESEMELPYAGLQQLSVSMLDHLEHLPPPQADALRTAFGLIEGPAPDRFLVGLAVLSLLSEAAGLRPLVCLVDDCQWLDKASAQALGFAARRIQAEGVLLAFAAREPSQDLEGIEGFLVEGLRDHDARALLRSAVPWPLDEQVRERILAETRGNPLALLELPRGLSPAELAGGFGLPQDLSQDLSLAGRIQESFVRRVEALPEATWLLVLLAAAEPVGDPALVWRAAARLGLARDAVVSAEEAGLVKIGGRVVFRHPLVRSAVYGASSPGDRRRVHVVLAAVTDPDLDPDRRAWHLAQATIGPDEEVAAELERSAARAQGRGGLAAAAAFLDRAVQLSLDPAAQARRALAAAHAKYLAGAPEAARRLLSTAEAQGSGPLGELERSQVDMIRAQIAYSQNRGSDAPALLLRAARRLEPLNLRMARQTYLDAVLAGHFAGRLAPGSLREAAEVARHVPHVDGPPAASDLLLDGLATALTGGYAAGAATLKQAVRAFRSPAATLEEQLRWLWPAAHVAMALWDDESYDVLSARHIEIAREAGVLAVLPTALTTRIVSCAFAGQLDAAEQLIEEMRALTDAMGTPAPAYGPVFVSAWRGREDAAPKVIDAAVRDFTLSGEGAVLAFADYARAVLCNGLGRYQDALTAATATDAFEVEGVTIYTQGLAELVEAAARVGAAERAADALARLEEVTRASDTDWGAGIRARSQALVSTDASEPLYREAIERLSRTRIRPQLARARLVYGEWLRREGRRVDARAELLQAFEMFADMGMDAFSERTRRELAATGEKIRAHAVERPHVLTSQEAQIARLAREGLTNQEIGFQLYLSARTVEWHLRKVFAKLGISSRRQLHTAVL